VNWFYLLDSYNTVMGLPIKLVLTKNVRKARYPKKYIGVELFIHYKIDDDHQRDWSNGRMLGLKLLLREIERQYGDVTKPTINFTDKGARARFGKGTIWISVPKWFAFISSIDSIYDTYLIARYNREFKSECRQKGIQAYLDGSHPEEIKKDLETSIFNLIEKLLSDFDNLQQSEKKALQQQVEYSTLGNNLLTKYGKLDKRSPKKYVKSIVRDMNSIGKVEAKELILAILKSKHSETLSEKISTLPKKLQAKMLKNIDRAAELLLFQERLESSLKKFKNLIKHHSRSRRKNEKKIHSFLADNYWLLGSEYYGTTLKSDIDSKGKKTGDTYIKQWKVFPDFLIEKVDQTTDTCVVMELEEANDKIFNKDKTLSKECLDGLYQAITYHIYYNVEKNKSAKGIAILGFTGSLNSEQKEKLRRLNDLFPKITIKTYDQIIDDAQRLLNFMKNYSNKNAK